MIKFTLILKDIKNTVCSAPATLSHRYICKIVNGISYGLETGYAIKGDLLPLKGEAVEGELNAGTLIIRF